MGGVATVEAMRPSTGSAPGVVGGSQPRVCRGVLDVGGGVVGLHWSWGEELSLVVIATQASSSENNFLEASTSRRRGLKDNDKRSRVYSKLIHKDACKYIHY